jgi:BirA family transcriptional regulator, biotin operon repressor / biotin---[acetyl-CoA-carboxylase] ligase
MRLHPAASAAGFGLAAYQTLHSTNAEALTLAPAHSKANPLWVTADEQIAGRGRRGNAWISPPGNLYATLLLRDPSPPAHAPQLSFVAALAAYDAVLACASGLREKLDLKWPNDVLCGGSKLAGILIESRSLDDGLAVAIGFGVNCQHHPALASYPAIDLAAAGAAVTAADLFFALSGTMLSRLEQWRRGEGFAAIRADWLDRAAGLGGELKVRLPDREVFGRWEALDETGRLLLRRPDGALEPVAAGDVFPVGAAGATAGTGAAAGRERVG